MHYNLEGEGAGVGVKCHVSFLLTKKFVFNSVHLIECNILVSNHFVGLLSI